MPKIQTQSITFEVKLTTVKPPPPIDLWKLGVVLITFAASGTAYVALRR